MSKQAIINKYIKNSVYDFVIDSAIPTLRRNGVSVPFWKHDDSVNDGMKMIEYEEDGKKQYEPHPQSPLTYYNFDIEGQECPEIGLDYEEQDPSSWISVLKQGSCLSFRFKNRKNNIIYQFHYENWKGEHLFFKFHEKDHLASKEHGNEVDYAYEMSQVHLMFLFNKLSPHISKDKLIVLCIEKKEMKESFDSERKTMGKRILEVGKKARYPTITTTDSGKEIGEKHFKEDGSKGQVNSIGAVIMYLPRNIEVDLSEGLLSKFKTFGVEAPMAVFLTEHFFYHELPKLTTKGNIGAVTHHIKLTEYMAFRKTQGLKHLVLFNFNQIVYEDLKFDKEKDDFIEQAIRKNNMFKNMK